MIRFKCKKKTAIEFFVLLLLTIVGAFVISGRNQYLPYYQMYLTLYHYASDLVEFSFNAIAGFYRGFFPGDDGFIYFLFTYAILGFVLHMYFAYFYIKKEQGWIRYLFFLMPYFCYFFIYWDLIQIRYAAGISFLLFGMFASSVRWRFFFFALAILFHNSMVLPEALFLLFTLIRKDYIKLIAVPGIAITALIGLQFTRYSVKYEQSSAEWVHLNLLGGNCLMLYLMVLSMLYFKKYLNNNYKKTVTSLIYTVSVLTLLIVVLNGNYPAIANRLLALTLFLAFICVSFVKGKYNLIFFIALSIVFSLWNLNIIVLDPNSFFNTPWYHY